MGKRSSQVVVRSQNEFAVILGGVLRVARQEAKKSVSELAESAGYAVFAIADIESGREHPAAADLAAYAVGCGTTAPVLLKRAHAAQALAEKMGLQVLRVAS